MSQLDTMAVLKQFVTKELLNTNVSINEDDNLLTDGLVDSLGLVRFIGFIEETFYLEIPPEDVIIENFRTIGIIATYLGRRKA